MVKRRRNAGTKMTADISLKYPKPKILLLDLPDPFETALNAAGFNAAVGTFGVPYAVTESDKLHYVSRSSALLPNVEEQEIIIVNTASPKALHELPVDQPGFGVTAYWQAGVEGEVDPRPLKWPQVDMYLIAFCGTVGS
jgi:hypothetical protein